MKILLAGYYGFGNFGDDLLFVSNYELIRKLFPAAEIDVYSEAPEPQYLEHLVNKDLKFLNYSSSGSYDYIWHGGGGVFFDFKKGKPISLIINSLIRTFGVRLYSKLYEGFKNIKKRQTIQFKSRIGFGLGVGDFTKSSDRFRDAIYKLSQFSLLIVRDEESICRVNKLKPGLTVKKSTDIVFDTELWLRGEFLPLKKHKGSLGIILRDWKMDDGYDYLPDFVTLSNILTAKGYQIYCFAFDANTDKNYISRFQSEGYEVNVWQPQVNSVNKFLSQLSNMNYIITSRFHGAIVGACLGVPGMCVDIEPKLKSAVTMLQGSYNLLGLPVLRDSAIELIEKDFLHLPKMEALAKKALRENREILLKAYSSLLEELKFNSI